MDEELRFAKKQQWSIAASAMALLGAIFGAVHAMEPLGPWEKAIAAILALGVAIGASMHLWSLQDHLAATRRQIDVSDAKAWLRGTSILYSLIGVLGIIALIVIYYAALRPATGC
jgi:hypothetical protein